MGLEQYRLIRPLESSTKVDAYEAEQIDSNRRVELWVLDRVLDSNSKGELRKSIKLAAQLRHPAIESILDYSVDQAPYFIALPCRRQRSMSDLANEVPLAPGRVMHLMRQVFEILSAAHRLGLAHADLRPNQIVIDDGERLKFRFTGLNWLTQSDATRIQYQDPNRIAESQPAPADDLFAAGSLLYWLLTGRSDFGAEASNTIAAVDVNANATTVPQAIRQLAIDLRAPDATDRPSANMALRRIDDLAGYLANPASNATRPSAAERDTRSARDQFALPRQLGRFRLTQKLGEGGMGVVFKAEDVADQSVVAVKVLNSRLAANPRALQRFEKEARMLAFVRSPYVTNLLDVNEDDGVHFIAMEFVAGRAMSQLLVERRRLDETSALTMIADVCRALSEAHARGVVHRDIKPENILLIEDAETGRTRIKLTDFGLARQIEQSESLDLTQQNVIGTPLYMAPEQGLGGGQVDARTDVYALGATLFHLLAGEPPFQADSPAALLRKHANDPLPSLQRINASISDGAVRLVERAMAKRLSDRFDDAAEMLAEIERLLRGEPSSVALHPLLPNVDATKIQTFEFRWELKSSPEQLWPYVANTERLNRAIGLPSVEFTSQLDGSGFRRFGRARKIGLEARWEEHPFEWVEGQRLGVLRVWERGPFEWITSVVELSPRADSGTNLTHRFQLVPRNLLGRVVAKIELGRRTGKALDRVYRACDEVIQQRKPGMLDDPFEQARALSERRRHRLQQSLFRIGERGINAAVTEKLGEFLEFAADQDVARIRPLAVADRLALDSNQFVAACLHAAREGLLIMLWDILCPICRVPSQIKDSLRNIKEHGHCEACNLDFELDFANSVELIFRAHSDLRDCELGIYCIGGPAHSPHVAAQVRVAAGERMNLSLSLSEGAYRLRGPQLPYAVEFRVAAAARRNRWEVLLSRPPDGNSIRALSPGAQTISLINDTTQELVVRVERTAPRSDALTAARAAAMPLFRELFPTETLAPGQLISVAQVTLLVTELDDIDELYRKLGDAATFSKLHEHFRLLDDAVRRENGAVVKTSQAGLIATFNDPVSALRAALEVRARLSSSKETNDLSIRSAVHCGPAYTATINDRLDYFGTTVTIAAKLSRLADPNSVAISRTAAADPLVSEYLQSSGLKPRLINIRDPKFDEPFAFCVSRHSQSTNEDPSNGTK